MDRAQAARQAQAAAVEEDEDMDDCDEDEDDDYEDPFAHQVGGRAIRRHVWLDESDDDSDEEWFKNEIMGRTREEVGQRYAHLMRTGYYPPG